MDPDKLRRAFRKLKAAYKRKYGKPFSCIWVIGSNGWPNCHLHILTDCIVSNTWLGTKWHKLTGAEQFNNERIRNGLPAAVRYLVANYVWSYRRVQGQRIGASRDVGMCLNWRNRKHERK